MRTGQLHPADDKPGLRPSDHAIGTRNPADGLDWDNGAPLALSFAGALGRFGPSRNAVGTPSDTCDCHAMRIEREARARIIPVW